MSTSAQVEAAWNSAIWQHATIQAITTAIYPYDLTVGSEFEIAKFRPSGEVNAILYSVRSSYQKGMTGQTVYRFVVDVQYLRFADTAGANWPIVRNFFDTLYGLVNTQLGESWGGTVDYFSVQESPPEIEQITLDKDQVFRGTVRYAAEQVVIN